MKSNTLYYGDCLEVVSAWPDNCVDLIYLDPPFNSNADYDILYGKQKAKNGPTKHKDLAQITAFTDTWEWDTKTAKRIREIKKAPAHRARNAIIALDSFYQGGAGMLAYLVYMADRIDAMHRLLKDTGSIYLHCDPTASHYLKMIMDDVFGAENFRNEIVWRIGWVSGFKTQKRGWIRNHDVLLYYVKTPAAQARFNKEYIPYPQGYVRRDGKSPNGKGVPIEDTWNSSSADVLDSIMIKSFSTEKLGYPTQKPLALLERIIKASSNKGEIVLDPFCGCGTTIEAAMSLQRNFIGIDISMYALDVIQKERLKDVTFAVDGVPADMSAAKFMARERPFAFEKWAVHRIPGFVSNNKQSGDGGIDGWAGLLYPPEGEDGICIAQVKGGLPGIDSLRAFTGKLVGGEASVGVFITMVKFDTPAVRKCIAQAGTLTEGVREYNRLVMWSVEEYFAGVNPQLPALVNPRTGKPLQHDLMVSDAPGLLQYRLP